MRPNRYKADVVTGPDIVEGFLTATVMFTLLALALCF